VLSVKETTHIVTQFKLIVRQVTYSSGEPGIKSFL
jgi:hypothetical protein